MPIIHWFKLLEYKEIFFELFTYKNINELQIIERKAIRFICNLYSTHDSPTGRCVRAHLIPLRERRSVNRVLFIIFQVTDTLKIN